MPSWCEPAYRVPNASRRELLVYVSDELVRGHHQPIVFRRPQMKSVTDFALGAEVYQDILMPVEKGKSMGKHNPIGREGFCYRQNIAFLGVNFRSTQTWTSTQGRASESE